MSQSNKMAVMPMRKLLINMSLPLMFSLLIQSLYNIVDSIFVSRLSENALTATSLAYPIQFLMIAISVGTAVGLNALMSRYVGKGNDHQASVIATTGLILCVITALVFAVIGLFFSNAIAASFTSDPEIQSLTATYMRICVVFCLGIFIDALGQRMLTAVGLTNLSMASLVTGAVTNIILDPILIFGYFGLPEMGIAGAAIATVIGQWLGAFVAIVLNFKKNPHIHFLRKGYAFQFKDVKEIYKIGLPTMIMQAVGSLMTASVNAILLTYSSTAVAFFGVYYKLQGFVMMPMNGLGQAVLPIAAFNYGSQNEKRIRELWKVAVPMALLLSLIGVACFLLLPEQLLSLFSASDEMKAIGVPALRIIGITFPLAAYSMTAGYFCTGLGNGVVNMMTGALRQFIALVPFIYIFAKIFGLNGCWFAFWLSEGAAFVYALFMVRKEMVNKVSLLSTRSAA